jgi:regulator of protease activity HflC (stomatin/prohibitin superfamily)
MERKNVTIREDQQEWVDGQDINLSQLVQDAIDEEMSPTNDELAAAYQANADHAAETNAEWSAVSMEANQHLDEPPSDE